MDLKKGLGEIGVSTWEFQTTVDEWLDWEDTRLVGAFLAVALVLMSLRLVSDPAPVGDANRVWRWFAEGVLAGERPYADLWDNKPPLWHVITAAAAATGAYIPALYGVITVTNGISAYLLYCLGRRHDLGPGALFASILMLSILHVGYGWRINPRVVAVPLILAALLVNRAVAVGALLAAACLLIQYSGLAIPAVVYYHYHRGVPSPPRSWLKRFAAAGIGVGVGAYAVLLAVWGLEVLEASLTLTLFEAEAYAERRVESGDSGFIQPAQMLRHLSAFLSGVQPWLVLAAFEIVAVLTLDSKREADLLSVTAALLAVTFTFQFFWTFRANRALFLVLPFVALLASAGLVRLTSSAVLDETGADQNG